MHQLVNKHCILSNKDLLVQSEQDLGEAIRVRNLAVKIIGKPNDIMEEIMVAEISGIVDYVEGMEPIVNFSISIEVHIVLGIVMVVDHEISHAGVGNFDYN